MVVISAKGDTNCASCVGLLGSRSRQETVVGREKVNLAIASPIASYDDTIARQAVLQRADFISFPFRASINPLILSILKNQLASPLLPYSDTTFQMLPLSCILSISAHGECWPLSLSRHLFTVRVSAEKSIARAPFCPGIAITIPEIRLLVALP